MLVQVYFNLHKKVFSVRAMQGEKKGLVIAHMDKISIKNPHFKVSQAGRQRVLKEKRKNVHAFVQGEMMDFIGFDTRFDPVLEVTYNPYKYEQFVIKTSDDVKANDYGFEVVSLEAVNGKSSIKGV
jgi:hypothetical protein